MRSIAIFIKYGKLNETKHNSKELTIKSILTESIKYLQAFGT
jgi:hypothetical protein